MSSYIWEPMTPSEHSLPEVEHLRRIEEEIMPPEEEPSIIDNEPGEDRHRMPQVNETQRRLTKSRNYFITVWNERDREIICNQHRAEGRAKR